MSILDPGDRKRFGSLLLVKQKPLGYALIAALVGVQIATIFFAIPPQALSQGVSGEAVHYHERIISRQSRASVTMATVMTLSAAELAAAGFQPNDEVLVFFFGVFAGEDNAVEVEWEITYGGAGSVITNTVEPYLDFGDDGRERAASWMGRLDLGSTIDDIDLDWRSADSGTNVYLEKAEFVVIRLADFGVEGVDWFWDKSTTVVANTTSPSSTNRAQVTWTPAEVEDWVAFGYVQTAIDQDANKSRVAFDLGGTVTADWAEEGESTSEELTRVLFDYAPALAASEQTYSILTSDSGGSSFNDHRESAVFVFRRAVWPDLYATEPDSQSAAVGEDTQIATITDAVSKDQNALMFGFGSFEVPTIKPVHMWIREGGSTILEPVIDDGSGLSNQNAYDQADVLPGHIMSYHDLTAGAQDLDLFGHIGAGAGSDGMIAHPRFLVWGLGLAVEEPEEEEAPPRTIILDAGIIQLISGKIIVLPNGEGGGAGPVYEE